MVKTGAWHSHAWRRQCDDCSYGAVSFAGCRTSGKDHGQQNVFEHPMLSGGVSGGSGVYENVGLTCIISHMALMILRGSTISFICSGK